MMKRSLASRASRATTTSYNRQRVVAVSASSALIVNAKSGGHAFIGYYLAKELIAKGHTVTIMNDGEEAKVSKKQPFNQYEELRKNGVNIQWGNPVDPATYPAGPFDVVFDNNGKDMDNCKPLIDTFNGKVSQYVFVASAGAYKADSIEPMHVEGDARNLTKAHGQVEVYLKEQKVPFTVVQPLYIYGPLTSKDCEQWWIDRIIRDRPVPIPIPGVQLTTLTHVEDVASMLAAIVGNKDAIGKQYNICSDRAITFQGIAKAVGKALGKEPNILLYSPEALGLGGKGKAEGFPFRTVHFFASSEKAKRELGWTPKHNFLADVKDLVEDYKKQGREAKEIDFTIDDKIIAAA